MSDERRSHGRSPWREAYEMMVARPTREPQPHGLTSLRFKQNAKGDWLVDELGFDQRTDETDEQFFERCEAGKALVQEMVGYYVIQNGGES